MRTKVTRKILSNLQAIIRCIGCGEVLSSGFHYTGSMIEGLQFATIRGERSTPVLGTMETYERSYVLGGETLETERKIAYYRRKKGALCDSCSSLCRKTITDRGGNKHQIVILDARQGFLGRTLSTEGSSPKPSYRTLNTTVTR